MKRISQHEREWLIPNINQDNNISIIPSQENNYFYNYNLQHNKVPPFNNKESPQA